MFKTDTAVKVLYCTAILLSHIAEVHGLQETKRASERVIIQDSPTTGVHALPGFGNMFTQYEGQLQSSSRQGRDACDVTWVLSELTAVINSGKMQHGDCLTGQTFNLETRRVYYFPNSLGMEVEYDIIIPQYVRGLTMLDITVLQKVRTYIDPRFLDLTATLLLDTNTQIQMMFRESGVGRAQRTDRCYIGLKGNVEKSLDEMVNPKLKVSLSCKHINAHARGCNSLVNVPDILSTLEGDCSHSLLA